MPYRKKLIEVALPLDAINRESAREKSIRHGHPSTLHLWWARRPLAACRAVLFASLVDDPDSDPQFHRPDGTVDVDRAGVRRSELFDLIEELVKWENSNNEKVLNQARAEIAASIASAKVYDARQWSKQQAICGEPVWNYICRLAKPASVNKFLIEHAPPVLDPFCGGGSIPLEAQRLGLRAYASDLNPVPVLINKALIEIPPKFANLPPVNPEAKKQGQLHQTWKGARGLAEDVRYYGQWMRDEAERRIGHLYPRVKITAEMTKDRPDLKPYVGQELRVIAWLWARTVASPNPAIGGQHVPLLRSFFLSRKQGRELYVEPVIDRSKDSYRFDVRLGKGNDGFDPSVGTVVRTGGTCILSGEPMSFEYIRAEGKAGRMSQRLLAVIVEGVNGRLYLPPAQQQEEIVSLPIPDGSPETEMPQQALGFRVQLYGVDRHHKLFTHRQLNTLTTFSALVEEARVRAVADACRVSWLSSNLRSESANRGPEAYADAVATYLGLGVSKLVDYNSNLVTWITQRDQARSTFSKQSFAMIWDFCEVNPFVGAAGDFNVSLAGISKVLDGLPANPDGNVVQLDATAANATLTSALISTDPPYYDNIGYADLSDFFYIWLRKGVGHIYPSLFATLLTPKTPELIATPYRHDGSRERAQVFFEDGLGRAFQRLRSVEDPDMPLTVFYAFKQAGEDDDDDDDGNERQSGQDLQMASTGWETMLTGLIRAGFIIQGTWPMRTERSSRSVSIGKNALASSIVLSCRSRDLDAPLATRREFLTALKKELPDALRHLRAGNIAPVDLSQAAIGPGMAIFTRYAKVMEADGSPMRVRQALMLINQALDEILAEQEGEFDADTRWALAWFEQFGMEDGPFGVAETLSKAKNTAINGLVEAGLIAARSGKVRLLKRSDLPADWNPATDKKLRHWEITQHLIRILESNGEQAAAALLRQLGGMAEAARDLAYRLYVLCERKKWTQEALAYNGLVIAWPEISKLAARAPTAEQTQKEMFQL